jgi:hypothetical protein
LSECGRSGGPSQGRCAPAAAGRRWRSLPRPVATVVGGRRSGRSNGTKRAIISSQLLMLTGIQLLVGFGVYGKAFFLPLILDVDILDDLEGAETVDRPDLGVRSEVHAVPT